MGCYSRLRRRPNTVTVTERRRRTALRQPDDHRKWGWSRSQTCLVGLVMPRDLVALIALMLLVKSWSSSFSVIVVILPCNPPPFPSFSYSSISSWSCSQSFIVASMTYIQMGSYCAKANTPIWSAYSSNRGNRATWQILSILIGCERVLASCRNKSLDNLVASKTCGQRKRKNKFCGMLGEKLSGSVFLSEHQNRMSCWESDSQNRQVYGPMASGRIPPVVLSNIAAQSFPVLRGESESCLEEEDSFIDLRHLETLVSFNAFNAGVEKSWLESFPWAKESQVYKSSAAVGPKLQKNSLYINV